MFEVDWSNPNRELVGDRRARKKKERAKERDGDELEGEGGGGSSRASESLRSSMSSVEKQFGFFGAKQRNNKNGSRNKPKSKSLAGSSLRAPTIDELPQTEQAPSAAPSLDGRQAQGQAQGEGVPSSFPLDLPSADPSPTFTFTSPVLDTLDDVDRAPGGSLFGCDITNPQPGFVTLFQELGDGVSMVIKTIDTTVRPRRAQDCDVLVSTATIYAGDDDEQLARLASSKASFKPTPKTDSSKAPPHFVQVVRPLPGTSSSSSSKEHPKHLPAIAEDTKPERSQSPHNQYKRRFRPRLSAPPIPPASQKPTDNPDTWKAPDDWDISPGEIGHPTGARDSGGILDGTIEYSGLTLDITHMQRELHQMVEASPQIILHRLKDTWGCYDLEGEPRGHLGENPDLDDGVRVDRDEAERALDAALAYKEREMENKRWLLSVLNNMEAIMESGFTLAKPSIEPRAHKVLALFETQATTTYVASVNHSIPVYHLSSDPLSHKRYPNIHPVICPGVSASVLGLAPDFFSAISCLPITSILPSSEIPKLLHNVHNALVPGGCLHMMIIDPWPVTDSMGPKLHDWLDENLIFNLELQFRCIHPSRMFPVWLSDARLRANGSIITTTRFQAVPQGRDNGSDMSGRSKDSAEGEVEIKKELRSMAGRLLWQEIWGAFVTGEQWWWEDEEIVDECVERETYWEYSIIAACKQEDDQDA